MIQEAFGDECLSRTRCFRWYNRFQSGITSTDEPRSEPPSTSTSDAHINSVNDLVLANRRLTVREIADEVEISVESCSTILTENLGLQRIASKLVPRVLTDEHKQERLDISQELLDRSKDDRNFLKTIVSVDETWVYGYDAETKAQSSQGKGPSSLQPKVMLIVFFDWEGIIHHEYVPKGQTLTGQQYIEVMRRLRDAMLRKRPQMWENKSWCLHHDNAPSYTSLIVTEFLAKNSTPVIPQPPYSPDLAPADFFLFPKLKSTLKGHRFETTEDIQLKCTAGLEAIPKEAFQAAFDSLKTRWERCIASQGLYFEGDKHDEKLTTEPIEDPE